MVMIMLNELTHAMHESGIWKSQHPVNPVSEQAIVRCLFTHAWVTSEKERFIRPAVSYRTCKRCGILQRAVPCSLSGQVIWQTMRERTSLGSQHLHAVEQQSFRQVPRRWPDGAWRKHGQEVVV